MTRIMEEKLQKWELYNSKLRHKMKINKYEIRYERWSDTVANGLNETTENKWINVRSEK